MKKIALLLMSVAAAVFVVADASAGPDKWGKRPTETTDENYDACFVNTDMPGAYRVLFVNDRSMLTEACETKMKTELAKIKGEQCTNVLLLGMTDRTASWDYNAALSEKRVDYVKKSLLPRNVHTITERYASETNPAVLGDEDATRNPSMRAVEVYVLDNCNVGPSVMCSAAGIQRCRKQCSDYENAFGTIDKWCAGDAFARDPNGFWQAYNGLLDIIFGTGCCGESQSVVKKLTGSIDISITFGATGGSASMSGGDNSISALSRQLSDIREQWDADKNVWRDADGNFNTTRLAVDAAAGVVLGTAGGLVVSSVVKKNQIKKGFEDIQCTVGGQVVAGFGDDFRVGR